MTYLPSAPCPIGARCEVSLGTLTETAAALLSLSQTEGHSLYHRHQLCYFPRLVFLELQIRGGTNRVFGNPCLCPLPKRGRFDEDEENDEFEFYPLTTRASLLRPPKRTKMMKMTGVTQAKAWFSKSLEKAGCVLR